MKVVAVLIYFDEDCSHLAAYVAALAKVPVDALVACDGRYWLFPDQRPNSALEQAETIQATCDALGFDCLLYRPREAYMEGEVEKRTLSLRLAETLTKPDDWLLNLDSDEIITEVDPDFRLKLEASAALVGSFQLWCENVKIDGAKMDGSITRQPIRRIYRARRGIFFDRAHYAAAVEESGELLYLNGDNDDNLAPCEDFGDYIKVEHRYSQRHDTRRQAKLKYYNRRDSLGIEARHEYQIEMEDGEYKTVPGLSIESVDGDSAAVPAAPRNVKLPPQWP